MIIERGFREMNINVLLLHIKNSDMDNIIKSNLITLVDKAIHDGDTVATLEEIVKQIENNLNKHAFSPAKEMVSEGVLHMFKKILHGDKKPNE